MPAKRKKEKVIGRYFTWLLGKRNGIYVADGRSNTTNVGRHSLGTRDAKEARELLVKLDLVKAVEFGLADRELLKVEPGELLPLVEGQQLYLAHVARPPVLGGATVRTQKRYRAVLDKFVTFAHNQGVRCWQDVSKKLLEGYTAWLDDNGYDPATEYLELTTLKQVIKWLVAEKGLPQSCVVALPLKKSQGTTTYCYTPAEVESMIRYCSSRSDLAWLGDIIVALVTTGLRIGELAALRWTDLDLAAGRLCLTDTGYHASKAERAKARTTKSHRDRTLPIHADLRRVLENHPHAADGYVFHGPLGGVLKPDTVRNILVREVLTPLKEQFPTRANEKGLAAGRLHSFRHYFCSACANSGVPEQVLMSWLGHRDSKMVRHYYHLHDEEAQRQMAKLQLVGKNVEAQSDTTAWPKKQ